MLELKNEDAFPDEFMEFISTLDFDFSASSGTLFNTCRSIDGDFVDQLAESERGIGKKMKSERFMEFLVFIRSIDGCLLQIEEELMYLDRRLRREIFGFGKK